MSEDWPGFTEAYIKDFGTLLAYDPRPGLSICPACKEGCGSYGHQKCRETYEGRRG